MTFSEPVAALPALTAALRLLLGEVAGTARSRGTSLRGLVLRARLADDGSWAHEVPLREPTVDVERMALAAEPALARVSAPVAMLGVRADSSGGQVSRQLSVIRAGQGEHRRRVREAVGQVRSALGDGAVLRAVELEPWSRLPERRWALIPFDTSPPRDLPA